MNNLTTRQAEILAFIRTYQQETGSPPTRAEIASEMGFKSPNAAEDHLRALARKHKVEPDALPALRDELAARLAGISAGEERLAELEAAVAAAHGD